MTLANPQQGYRILYVDDDVGLCRLVSRHLSRQGYVVSFANSGEDGLHLLTEQSFYVTGAEDSRLAVSALKAGASDYVMKSDAAIFFELLDEAVRTSLERVIIVREKEEAAREVAEANTRLAALVAQQQAMLREVDHRVANSLQIMGALPDERRQAYADLWEEVKAYYAH